MSIIERVKALQLPLDQLVVIGSGVLDALLLRESDDIDLAVSETLFQRLQTSGEYQEFEKYGEYVLEAEKLEIWRSWGSELPFETLKGEAIAIEGIYFCHPSIVIRKKQQRGLPKDIADIRMLQNYVSRTS